MIQAISSWAEQIVVAVVIGTIIEMILPGGNNKKYIKTVIGVYILFTIISPVIGKISGQDLNNISLDYEKYFNDTKSYEVLSKDLISTNDANVETIYTSKLKEDMKNKIEEKGYKVETLDIQIELNDSNNYGKLKKIDMKITKMDNKENEGEIVINEIKIGNTKNNTNEVNLNISKSQIKSIKEYLESVYNIEQKDIYINENK